MPAGKKPVWRRFDTSEPLRAQHVADRLAGRPAQNSKHADGWPLASGDTVVKLDAIEDRHEVLLQISFSREQSDPA